MSDSNALMNALFAQAGVPLCNIGGPGVGKTRVLEAVAKAIDYRLETIVLSSKDPTEILGVMLPPEKRGTGVAVEPPAWVIDGQAAWDRARKRTIVFFDEANTAPPATMAPAMKMMDEKRVGMIEVPWASFIAAINPPEIACGGQELAPPVANRLAHRDWEMNLEGWIHGMISGFQIPSVPRLPEDWETLIPTNAALVAAFVKKMPTRWYDIPKNEDQRGKAWPSPRTWTLAARMMAAAESVGLGSDGRAEVVSALVGSGSGMEFANWCKEMDLPNPEDLLKNWKKFKVGNRRADQLFAISAGVAAAFVQRKTSERWEQVWGVLNALADAKHADVAGLAAQTVVNAVLQMPPAKRREEYPMNAELQGPFLPLIAELRAENK